MRTREELIEPARAAGGRARFFAAANAYETSPFTILHTSRALEAGRTAKPPQTHTFSLPAIAPTTIPAAPPRRRCTRRRLTPVPQHRTKIDYLEKVAQLYYAVSLLAFPENWLAEQFQDKSLGNNDAVLALMSIMGLLVLTIIVITFIIRNAKNTRAELMKKMDLAAAGCWSFFLVNSIRLMNDGIFEDAAFKQNCGIYSVIIAAYAYQSTTRKPKSK